MMPIPPQTSEGVGRNSIRPYKEIRPTSRLDHRKFRVNEGQPHPRDLFALWRKIAQIRRSPILTPIDR